MTRHAIIAILIILLAGVVSAQEATPELTPEATEPSVGETCPAIVAQALDFTKQTCSEADTNEACYGYTLVDAELRSDRAQFIQPGDIEQLINIQSVQLSPLDELSGQWGVIVLNVEANANPTDETSSIADDLQIVLYGDAELSDASTFIEVTASTSVNVRERPSTDGRVVGSLAAGDTIISNGRLSDDSWFRVRFSADDGITNAWVAASFLETDFDASTLPVIPDDLAQQPQTDVAAQYGPMQALVFQSGENDSPCEEAPNSGMLIQTPEGAASVNILLDEVVIQLDGTGVISAQADGNLTVGVIEGTAQVSAEGGVSTATAGQAVDVPLSADLVPVGEPEAPRPLEPDEVQAVPVDLLDTPVTIPDLNAPSGLASASDGFAWRFAYTSSPPYICSDGTEIQLESAGVAPSITEEADAIVISGLRIPEISPGVYQVSYSDSSGNLITDTLQLVSSDRLAGERTFDLFNPICTLTVSISFQLSAR